MNVGFALERATTIHFTQALAWKEEEATDVIRMLLSFVEDYANEGRAKRLERKLHWYNGSK